MNGVAMQKTDFPFVHHVIDASSIDGEQEVIKAWIERECDMDNGDVYVLEMNCRFGGQYPFTHNAGVNIPLLIIKWLEGQPTDHNLTTQKNGVKSCKELIPVVFL